MLSLDISKKDVGTTGLKPVKPIMKEKKIPENVIKICNKIQEYNAYTADITFCIPFIFNGLGLMDMSLTILPVFIADIVYRVANITTCTIETLENKETKKKITYLMKKSQHQQSIQSKLS